MALKDEIAAARARWNVLTLYQKFEELVIVILTGLIAVVVVFAVYPFAAALFKEANYPKRLLPGIIALGAFTATMDCLPMRKAPRFR